MRLLWNKLNKIEKCKKEHKNVHKSFHLDISAIPILVNIFIDIQVMFF